jgi:hypothetical protein
MLQRYFVLLLLVICPFSGAEPVGDFSPLEVGNEWVYKYKKWADCLIGLMPNDSFTVTIFLVSSLQSNDSIIHCFENRIEGMSINTTFISDTIMGIDTIFDTTWIDSMEFDTLIETNTLIRQDSLIPFTFQGGGISNISWLSAQRFEASRWSTPVMPIWETHYVETDSKISNTGLLQFLMKDEAHELIVQYFTKKSTYRQNIGMISYYYGDRSPPGPCPTTDITLLSFKNDPFNAVQTGPAPLQARPRVVPVVKLSLPHLSIENNGRVFNLQGRAVPAKAIPGRNARNPSMVQR